MSEMETESELVVDPTTGAAAQPATALFAGVSGVVDPEQLRAHAEALTASGVFSGVHITLAYPGADASRVAVDDTLDLLSYPLPAVEGTISPWAHTAAAQASLLRLAAEPQGPAQAPAQVVALLHHDLAALAPPMLMQLAGPVLAREADLVMASYAQGPFDSLLNQSILAPLSRALYGRRVRFPLAPDFAVSPRMAARLAMGAPSGHAGAGMAALWPATVAAGIDATVLEARLGIHHPPPASGIELSTVIALLAGSCFAEMEVHAPLWQRVRANTGAVPRDNGSMPATSVEEQAKAIDTEPMIKSFLLGSRSLQDVWGMVLPPVTLLDLKRLTLLAADKFRLPDELWVRIVYDFALGYRLRTINRTHLLGALTPLYLGWVASFVNEAASDPGFDSEARSERLARAFEDGKPYLVRRWRWPDRFNP